LKRGHGSDTSNELDDKERLDVRSEGSKESGDGSDGKRQEERWLSSQSDRKNI
jgi:hypothetical protein